MAGQKIPFAVAGRRWQSAGRHSLAVLLATTALGVVSAHAIDGTWTGASSSEWTDGTNWTSNPSVPDGTATFTDTGLTTVDSNGLVIIGSVNFTTAPNAQAYTVNVNDVFLVNAGGMSNSSTNTQTFNVNATMVFQNSSSAGSGLTAIHYNNSGAISFQDNSSAGFASIANSGDIEFNNNSSAGSATITNNASVNFQDSASAGSAVITNTATGTLTFNATASAGFATITNNGSLQFTGSSSAGNASISTTSGSGATITFNNTSTAANSNIALVDGTLTFNNASTAANATITNNSGGTTTFGALGGTDTSNAGTSHITNNNSGTTNFLAQTSAMNATIANNSGGNLNFQDQSTAGNATIVNNSGGTTTFGVPIVGTDTATAGNAVIINNSGGTTEFTAASTAGNATIINSLGGIVQFGDSGIGVSTATAGSSTIDNSGVVSFNASTTAGSATITTHSGGNVFFFDTSSGGSARFITDAGGTVDISAITSAGTTAGSIEGAGSYVLGAKNFAVGSNNLSTQVSGVISGVGGSLTKVGSGTLILSGTNTYTGVTTISAGTLQLGNGGTTGSIVGDVSNNAILAINRSNAYTFNGVISGSGALRQIGAGTTTLTALESFTGLTTITAGTLALSGAGNIASSSGVVANGAFDISAVAGAGTSIQTLSGNGSVALGAKTLTLTNASGNFAGVIGGSGGLTLAAGAETLSGINTYTGATTVNGGVLSVNGSIAASSLTTVNAGGTLAGNGIVGNTTINGGTLAPGNSIGLLTVQGNLIFTAAASYMVEVSPANADRTNVTGTATLAGATVKAVFSPGSYVNKQYTIINATGGVNGTFNALVNTNLPANFSSALSYDANDAYLNLTLNFVPPPSPGFPGGLNVNQQNVANTLVKFFNTTGGIPLAFGALNAAGLTVASGELGTGVIQSSIKADDLFLNLLLDPTVAGRGAGFTAPGSASQFADDQASAYAEKRLATPTERAAYAMVTKAPLLSAQPINRWSVWSAAYGGSAKVDGNAFVGSQDTTARVWGVVGGADYKVTPDSLIGFALAGGGTNYSLANALGSGSADVFQAGAFGRHNFGPAYVSAALAYGWHDVTTNRTVTLAGFDQLQARFRAETFSARFEGGYRFATPVAGITPYVAAQAISFRLPAYAEAAVIGTPLFALNYAGQTTTATRTELGLRSDRSFAMQDAMLTLRGRAAWAHDYNPDRAVTALFQALPGTSFVVNGARGNPDAALVSAGAEIKWLNGFSLAGTFEGEFSGNTTSYAGKGVAKYSW